MSIRLLIAPSGFKECLSASEAADAIARGARQAWPDACITTLPMLDGGEGFTVDLTRARGGQLHWLTVQGPCGNEVLAPLGVLDHGTVVLDIASAAGLSLVPRDQRDPTRTSSRGVGQLLRAALDRGARRVVIGCGDSGVNDGGLGMAQALGVRFRDAAGGELGPGGAVLQHLHQIDLSGLDPRLHRTRIDVAVNLHNGLLGEQGVSRVYGPQKGATPEQAVQLDRALARLADHIRQTLAIDVAALAGAGASGGLGAGLVAFAGARLHARFDLIEQQLDLDRQLRAADLVITAEGQLDAQSLQGKVPGEIVRRAARHGVPVIALGGSLGPGADALLDHGAVALACISHGPTSLDTALQHGARWLQSTTARTLALMRLGQGLACRQATALPPSPAALTAAAPVPARDCVPVSPPATPHPKEHFMTSASMPSRALSRRLTRPLPAVLACLSLLACGGGGDAGATGGGSTPAGFPTASQTGAPVQASQLPPGPPPGDNNTYRCGDVRVGAIELDTVDVPDGARCALIGTRLKGSIRVGTNAVLEAVDVQVNGNLQAEGSRDVFVSGTSRFGGSVQIKQGDSATVAGAAINGDLQYEQMDRALVAAGNRVGGNIQVNQNRGGVRLQDNTANGNLQCQSNEPAPVGGGNRAASKEDQCARL